jgi:hypothetical protein
MCLRSACLIAVPVCPVRNRRARRDHVRAVVGDSRSQRGVGYEVLRAVVAGGFTGRAYPVNPHTKTIDGLASLRGSESTRRRALAGTWAASAGQFAGELAPAFV